MGEEAAGDSDDLSRTLDLLLEIRTSQGNNTRRLDLLAGDVDSVREELDAARTNGAAAGPGAGESEERLSAVERTVKWATPWRNVGVLVGFFLVGGVGVLAALRTYAEEAVIETVRGAHGGDAPLVEPSVKTVTQLRNDVGSMKSGVDCLVATRARAKEMKEVEIELELHRQQHAELVQEWTSKKAARRNAGDKPKKSDGHVALEAALKTLSGMIEPQCKEEAER